METNTGFKYSYVWPWNGFSVEMKLQYLYSSTIPYHFVLHFHLRDLCWRWCIGDYQKLTVLQGGLELRSVKFYGEFT